MMIHTLTHPTWKLFAIFPRFTRSHSLLQGTRGRRSIDFAKNIQADGRLLDDNYSIHNQKNDNEALNHDDNNHVGDPVSLSSTESIRGSDMSDG